MNIDDIDQRNLLTMGSSSTSLAFSFASSAGAGDFCIDYLNVCLEAGKAITKAKTDADAGSNSVALAYSEANLWLQAYCSGCAEAYAQACSFTKAEGKVNVDVSSSGGVKAVSLRIQLISASTSYALASSKAVADAYTAIDAQSFTDTVVYCNSVANMSPLCAGTARTDLKQIAVATAGAFSDAVSEAGAGGLGAANAAVYVDGSSISTVSGHLMAMAKSWAFASAEASAGAFAVAVTELINKSYSAICVKTHGTICGMAENYGKGVCGSSPEVACASAKAFGEACGSALAISCAHSYIEACSASETTVYLKADVDCKTTPKLKWKSARGGAQVTCPN
jgi:hypothetical protein